MSGNGPELNPWSRPLSLTELLEENGADAGRVAAVISRGHGGHVQESDKVLPPLRVTVEIANEAADSADNSGSAADSK